MMSYLIQVFGVSAAVQCVEVGALCVYLCISVGLRIPDVDTDASIQSCHNRELCYTASKQKSL